MTQQTPVTFSDKGLASYGEASPEYELAPIGIASMQEQVKRLAEFGRRGDIYVIHAAEGETVIPMEVLDANPQIKTLLFNQMEEMGLDPERYIIGNELNSINPVTGMPEFFSFNPFKAVKKVVKKVVKFAKKIAPIALPIIAAGFGFPYLLPSTGIFAAGSMGSMALASGIGTLIGGGSVKDAFKSALIAGGTAGILGGFKGMRTAGEGVSKWDAFTGGVKQAAGFGAPVAPLIDSSTGKELVNIAEADSGGKFSPLASGDASQVKGIQYFGTGKGRIGVGDYVPLREQVLPALDSGYTFTGPLDPFKTETLVPGNVRTWDPRVDMKIAETAPTSQFAADVGNQIAISNAAKAAEQTALVDKTASKLWLGEDLSPSTWVNKLTGGYGGEPSNVKDLALIAGGLYAGGAFTPAEEEPLEDVQQQALAALDPIVIDPLAAQAAQIDVTTQIPTTTAAQLLQPSIFTAAQGGAVNYPRREALVEGPGTTTSDDIPAMLSDGEFVINSKAVQGADPSGRGNRYAGAQNLYNMMRNFEMRA